MSKYSVSIRMSIDACDEGGNNRVPTGHRIEFNSAPADLAKTLMGWYMELQRLAGCRDKDGDEARVEASSRLMNLG